MVITVKSTKVRKLKTDNILHPYMFRLTFHYSDKNLLCDYFILYSCKRNYSCIFQIIPGKTNIFSPNIYNTAPK
jgi:hypothetical protein